jgi:hypothetical protein
MKGKTYTVTGAKNSDVVWKFTYDLEGFLSRFEFLEGKLTAAQCKWLFDQNRFPYHEQRIAYYKTRKDFLVDEGMPDLSFDTFWDAYGRKQKRKVAQKLYLKLTDNQKLLAIKMIKPYKQWCKLNHTAVALPDTYISQERWTDEF